MEFSSDILHSIYIHDNHKIMSEPHIGSKSLPLNVDKHSAMMSRPSKPPASPLYADDEPSNYYRVSLINGQRYFDKINYNKRTLMYLPKKLCDMSVEELHDYFLGPCDVDGINESYHFPYTSLKYHLLIAGALYCNYVRGDSELCLAVTENKKDFKTILSTELVTLCIMSTEDTISNKDVFSRLGSNPHMNFGNTWSRANGWFIKPSNTRLKALDFNLRRLSSWSTALSYIEEVIREINNDVRCSGGVRL